MGGGGGVEIRPLFGSGLFRQPGLFWTTLIIINHPHKKYQGLVKHCVNLDHVLAAAKTMPSLIVYRVLLLPQFRG